MRHCPKINDGVRLEHVLFYGDFWTAPEKVTRLPYPSRAIFLDHKLRFMDGGKSIKRGLWSKKIAFMVLKK